MNQSTINFVVKTLGATEAAREFDKISAAATRAGAATDKAFLKTKPGQKMLLDLQVKSSAAHAENASAANKAATATNRLSSAHAGFFAHIARTTVQSALVNQLFLQFVDVAGQAAEQVDLMKNFPATMASMGESTAEASQAMDVLRTYVGQVGGNLGDATSMVTRFTGATKDVKSATAIFVGLNNALIAGDSSMEEQRQAAVQFAQALERGKPDMREWRTLTQNMSFQLTQVAKSMGYVNANELGEALTSGKESMAAFTTALTKMSTGTGDIAQQAMARMNGMQFSFNVLKNTMVQGLAAIINAVGRQNIVSFFQFLTQVVQVLAGGVVKLIGVLITLFNFLANLFGLPTIKLQDDVAGIADGIGAGAGAAEDLGDGLDGAADSADKLSKSLASFDKMNVLPEPKAAKDTGGGAGFDSAQIGELGDLLGDITGELAEASKWAKVFAGIIAGLVGVKFAQAILGELKKVSDGFRSATSVINSFKDATKSGSFGAGKDAGQKIGSDLKNGMADSFKGVSGLIGGIIGGLASTVGPAIAGVVTAGAAALGVSVGVFVAIIAVAIGAIVIVILTIKDNWDAIVSGMEKVWKTFTDILGKILKPAIDEINKQWDNLIKVLQPVIDKVKEAFKKLGDFLAPIWQKITDAVKPFVDKIKELYQQYIQPLIDKFKAWAAEIGPLMAVLKVLGIIITVVVLAPFALVVIAIGLVVAIVAALAAAIIWVIAKFIEFAAYVIGGGLWEDIQALVAATGQWIQDKFNEAVEFVKSIFITIGKFFQDRWNEVVAVFAGVGQWFRDRFSEAWEAVKLIWSVLGDWFKERWDNLTTNLSMIGTWFKEKFQQAWDGVTAIWGAVSGWFGGVWAGIKNVFNGIGEWFGSIFQQAWNKITGVFSGLWSWFRDNVWNKIVGVFSSIGTSIGDAVSGAFKGVINTALNFVSNFINGLIRGINGAIGVINKIPGVSIGRVGEVSLPRLARGGIVTQPTAAVIGESGKEAIVPLENNLEWLDKLAAKINQSAGGSQPVQLTVQIGEEKIATQIIDLINEKTHMSGRNVIYV